MRNLPVDFLTEMNLLFERFDRQAEWSGFIRSFSRQCPTGLRANSLKIDPSALERLFIGYGQPLIPVPWSEDGFYLPGDIQAGKLPWHSAGLYYIQEPSAMLPAAVLAARPGERVLDLCAAPGGKSTRIAADLKGQGLLWANEISADRARALLHNLERIGCRNCLITQETPERLAVRLPLFFDAILVDAPCSGSGMFRRDPAAIESWLRYGSRHCTELQRRILRSAWCMLRPGGRLVYSTCTFSLAENEEMIEWLLSEFPACRLLPIPKAAGSGVEDGLPVTASMVQTARIWPHRTDGDGHFCALLLKTLDAAEQTAGFTPNIWEHSVNTEASPESAAAWRAFRSFLRSVLTDQGYDVFCNFMADSAERYDRGCLHLLPADAGSPAGLRKLKTGMFLGQARLLRDRSAVFEPSQALLGCLPGRHLRHGISGDPASDLIRRFLRGETLSGVSPAGMTPGEFGAVLLSSADNSWPLGWVKAMPGGMLKNLYPQAWRRVL